jgi:hypothetical protein
MPPPSNYWTQKAKSSNQTSTLNTILQNKPVVAWSDLEPEKMDLYYNNNKN